MKKLISLLLMLALALVPAAALANVGDANLATDLNDKYSDSIHGAFVLGDTLYISGYAKLYTYHIGDAEIAPLEYQLPESAENESQNVDCIFTDGERAYALVAVYNTGENYTLARVELRELTITGDAVEFGEAVEVDSENLTSSYGSDQVYFIQVNSACCSGGRAYLSVYDDMGQSKVYVLDIATGSGAFIENLEEPQLCIPWGDGLALIETCDSNSRNCALLIYDPESESLTPACEPIEADDVLQGLAYSQESGRLFYLADGYVMAVENFDFDNAQPVAEFSTNFYNNSAGALLPGDYYVYATYDVVGVRSTDAAELPETRLTIDNSGYSDAITSAYYDFSNTHGDVAVVLSNTYLEASEVIEAMMNRDSSFDIYLTNVQSQAYDSLFQRGYMAELNSEKLKEAVGAMYPAFQDVLMRNGEVVALPVNLYGWVPALNLEGFEKIGISREEIPTNWPDFLDFLTELPDKLPEDGKVRIFDESMTQDDARSNLMSIILEGYQNDLAATGRDPSYDTPELRALLEKVLNLDYEALGLREDDESDSNGGSVVISSYTLGLAEDERTYTLFEMSTGCTLGNFYTQSEPWPLSIVPGEEPLIALDLTVAFVNPFSEHLDLAREFMETVYDNLDAPLRYNTSDALNEPVRNSHYEESVAEIQKQMDEAKAALEKAEPVDKPMYEENIAELERVMDEIDQFGWDISPKGLEWYRAHDKNLFVARYNYASNAEDLYDLSQQLLAGKIDASTFLKAVDQKVRMMALEGN